MVGKKTIAIIIVAILLVVVYYVMSADVVRPDISFSGKKITCDINIDADIFSNADINSAICTDTGKSCTVGFQTLSLIGFKGKLQVQKMGITYATKDIEAGFIGTDNVVMVACVPDEFTSVDIKLTSKDGGMEDIMQEVNIGGS